MRYSFSTYEQAAEILAGGRDKDERRIGKTRRLWRFTGSSWRDDHLDASGGDIIVFRLHDTDIITYLPDGTQIIYMGGWNTTLTVTDLNRHSAASVYSAGGRKINGVQVYSAIWHNSDPLSPPKVWKCRRGKWSGCGGTGEVKQDCYGARSHYCEGSKTYCFGWPGLPCEHGFTEEHDLLPVLCEHGFSRSHHYHKDPCDHGKFEPHFVGMVTCGKCSGTGRFDYGSYRMPTPMDSHTRYLVDADGKVIGEEGSIGWAMSPYTAGTFTIHREVA